MVSGFFTSPLDHMRMVSAVARPMRSCEKSFTSSMGCSVRRGCGGSWCCCCRRRPVVGVAGHLEAGPLAPALVLFVAAPLGAAEVDAELLGGAEHVLVELPHLDLLARLGQDLDVQAQGLH